MSTYRKNWIGRPSPKSQRVGIGWLREMGNAWTDVGGQYCVMSRTFQTEWGTMVHVCLRNATSTDIPWAEKQRIKNELFGTDRTAIEVFPAEADLVDAANMYHFWVLPPDMTLPFTLKT